MIPSKKQCLVLWDKYNLSSKKRIHTLTVTELALYLADKITEKNPQIKIDKNLLQAAALLHDVDKNIKPLPGERHPETGVRMLRELDMEQVAEVVNKHAVHRILDPELTPKTWEEKLLYLADRMVKYEVIGVEHRFNLWYRENLSEEAVSELKVAFPRVKQLEQEVYQAAEIGFDDIEKEFGS